MNEIVLEWIRKAETDLRVAKKLLELNEENWVIAYHLEQAAEKYLKAFLVAKKRKFMKTHDIKELLELCIQEDKEFEKLKELEIEYLKEYSSNIRYPYFYEPEREEVLESLEKVEKVREFVLKKLDIKTEK